MELDKADFRISGAERPQDEVDIRQFVDVLMAGKWWILLIAVSIVVLGAAYAFLAAPIYKADGLIEVEQNEKGLASATHDIESLLLGESTEAEAEIQILQSRLVLDQVIGDLGLDIVVKPKVFPLIGGAIFRARSSLEQPADPILGFASYAWGGERAAIVTLNVPEELWDTKMYLLAQASGGFILMDKHREKLVEGKVGVLTKGDTSYGPVEVQVKEIWARPGTEFVVKKRPREDVLKDFSHDLKVAEQGKKSGVIQLTLKGETPKYVQEVLTSIEDAYIHQNIARRSEEAGQSLDYLQLQLPIIKGKVDAAQSKLNEYQSSRGSVDVSTETQLILKQLVDLETQRLQLEQSRREALQRFTSQHPVVQSLNAQIADLSNKQAEVKSHSQTLPQIQQDLLQYKLEVDANSALYETLLDTVQQLEVAKAGTVGDVRIVDQPALPWKPDSPRKPLVIALSAILGLFLGVLVVYLQRALIRGVDQPDVVEREFGIPTYATVPYVQRERTVQKSIQRGTSGTHILALLEPNNAAIESLRSLRSSLHFAMLEATNNVVMFCGPSPGLGKSFISINMGVVIASTGKRVVVIDADLRRGHLHRSLSLDVEPGISDFVAGNADMASILRPTSVDGLFFISKGVTPPNPSELLMHDRFASLIKSLETQFDYVLIDSPPVLPVADAMIIGRHAGSVLLILKSAEHPLHVIEETLRRLQRSNIKVKGVIFNQVGMRAGSYGYGGYGYDYSSEYSSR